MRLSIIGLIFFRELRDQLRDRRTLFMIAVLPVVLYPILGAAVVQFAVGSAERPSTIGIAGAEHLPPLTPASAGFDVRPAVGWLTITPLSTAGLDAGITAALGGEALVQAAHLRQEYPPLLIPAFPNSSSGTRCFPSQYFERPGAARSLRVELLASGDRSPLNEKQVDLIVLVPPGFCSVLEEGGRPVLQWLSREGDEQSRTVAHRLAGVMAKWKQKLREVRLLRQGLPTDYADPIAIKEAERVKGTEELAAEGLLDLLVRLFPFLLVMWSLAGALYPAVDLCAGEKERGTMETLLISPTSREEIVWGKFLTIWVFSAATAFLNLASMGITTAHFSGMLTHAVLRPAALLWCVLLALPLSAFFSALGLAVGAYARSSKEGQYYLMPLFVVTMPLVFLTLAPGVELNPFYSLVPVTGVALLLKRLMTSSLEQVPWLYFVPVLVPMVLYSWLALRWAIEQFKREEVLFREAERLDFALWLRRLFREKEPLPSAGQALFCFFLILALRWLFVGGMTSGSLLVSTGVVYLAFVAAPPLFMALLLTTRPREGLGLRLPSLRALLLAALLAGLLLAPLAELTSAILGQFPMLKKLLSERQPLVEELLSFGANEGPAWWHFLLVLVVMPAVWEEIAFRGFILSGLRRRLQPWTAVLVSSFLFALYHMNVFQALPSFVLGVVLGLLTLRSGSIFPGMLFHFLHNGLLIGVALLARGYAGDGLSVPAGFHPLLTAAFAVLAVVLLTVVGVRVKQRTTAASV